MLFWRLIKISNEVLSVWRKLADTERQRVQAEADRVRLLTAELTGLAGSSRKREHRAKARRDAGTVSAELLGAIASLSIALGPATRHAARRSTPRSLRLGARAGSFGVRQAKKRWG